MLSIATRLLTPGSSYRLQVDYDGGQTGILSFTYADEIVLEGYHEGDRDGGDAGGNPPDTIIQPPPEDTSLQQPPESADSKKPVFSEFFDETTDRISGTLFLMMLQTGEQRAVFSKQGITISIPKNALPEGIQNEDQIEVIIQKDTDGGFSFRFPSMELRSAPCRMFLSCCPVQMTRQPAHGSSVMKAAWKSP